MTDKETRQALAEAISADVRTRVDLIADQFIRAAFEAVPRGEVSRVLDIAVAEVSAVLGEGVAAQAREWEKPPSTEADEPL